MRDQEAIWDEYDNLSKELLKDLAILEGELQRNDTQTSRRCFCRSVLAYIEGISTWMAKCTVHYHYPNVLGEEEKRELERRNGAIRRLYNAFDLYTDTSGAITPFKQGSNEWDPDSTLKCKNSQQGELGACELPHQGKRLSCDETKIQTPNSRRTLQHRAHA
jgi:hypothetical protein